MNIDDLRKGLAQVDTPSIEPGEHMQVLEAQLAGRSRSVMRRHWRAAAVAGAVLLTGLGFAAGPFVARISQTVAWQEIEPSFISIDQVAPQYRSELAAMWERGEGVLLETRDPVLESSGTGKPVTRTSYRVAYTFKDGHTEVVTAYAPPEPARRAELKRLVAQGQGETSGPLRNQTTGMVTYLNDYVLSGGDVIRVADSFPAMSGEKRREAMRFVSAQIREGQGVVVGELNGMPVVEYRLPDGEVFTSVSPTTPAKLTPERENEILTMKHAGQGRLVEPLISNQGTAYLVEYELSDGTVFRIGEERPPMTDAEWDRARTELGRKLAREDYVQETIVGSDGQPVDVISVTLDSAGFTFTFAEENLQSIKARTVAPQQ